MIRGAGHGALAKTLAVAGALSCGSPAMAADRELPPPYAGEAVQGEILEALRSRQFLDAHMIARMAATLSPESSTAARYRTYDALALIELDETVRARAILHPLATDPAESTVRQTARVLRAWSYLRDRDEGAFSFALSGLPPDARARLEALEAAADPNRFMRAAGVLPPPLELSVSDAARALWTAQRTKRPWLAATLSVIPGAGQAYAGSWQGAAVAFFLNAVLIGATAELAYRKLYVTAAAAGVATSFFYFGNIINAADLASRRNEMAAESARLDLERRLLPEAHP